ncbi:hypothetical protein [Acidovorax radicis]|uniref:hypothetical protein n=1 Tax=Acidovorax radicis TaxID=758826 RepID=UPI001CFB9A11|nr:hypothetical protein [Acidovorax radicis]UCV00277.1 hypothetical protein KI609_05685 [Acidovorax radicis]
MTPAEIIAMAKEVIGDYSDANYWPFFTVELERFAALVAAKEREACAQVCDEMRSHYSDYKDTALLNGDVELSNAASGEPRACEFLAKAMRARSPQ